MDKYEFNIKAEQIRKMADKGDYQTAMQIADTIDWRRVKNANLLAYIADIYDMNNEYKEAGYIYRIALERTPQSKRFIYRLCEISLKSGNINEAMDFYDAYCRLDPMDSSKFLLNYMILEKKGAGPDQLISVLENYTSMEIDEKWLYELAVLYAKAGREKDAVKICDKISLLFGFGKYVDKSLELKMNFAPLSGQQIDLINNRDKYEKKLEIVSETYRKKNKASNLVNKEDIIDKDNLEESRFDDIAFEDENSNDENFEEDKVYIDTKNTEDNIDKLSEEEEEINSTSKTDHIEDDEANNIIDQQIKSDKEIEEKDIENQYEDIEDIEDIETLSISDDSNNYNMIIESDTDEQAFQTAIDEIRYYHSKYNLKFKVAKTSSDRVNKSGFNVFVAKISDKDFIIEKAGNLNDSEIESISEYIKKQQGETSIVLIDSVDRFDNMAKTHPEFMNLFDVVSDVSEDAKDRNNTKDTSISTNEEKESLNEKKDEIKSKSIETNKEESKKENFAKGLSLDEFVKVAMEYADNIDCTVPGKTVLAIYERAEYMKDNGEILDKIAAENLIEEAADKAENPGIGKKLSSMFSSKYDKNDKLILRKEDFLI